LGLGIDALWVGFGAEFLEIEDFAVVVHIPKDMGILFSFQPFILLVELQWYRLGQSFLEHVVTQSRDVDKGGQVLLVLRVGVW